MENFIDIASLEAWQLWMMAGIGLLLAVLGFRIKKVAFFIIWFVLGFLLMNRFMPSITGALPDIANNPLWTNLITLGGGLLMALLGFTVEKICLGGICFALVIMITSQFFGTEIQTMVIGAVVGVVAAGAAVMLMKPATIIATAVAGGYLMAVALPMVVANMDAESYYWPILLGTAAVGSIIQFVTTRHE